MTDIRVVRATDLSSQTAQTSGMNRMAAIEGDKFGSRSIWAGRVTMDPGVASGAHHHGDCESVIFVVSGSIQMRWGDSLEHSLEANTGDFIHVPANLVHQEINRSKSDSVDCVVIRDPNENVVINVDVGA
jgi:uncharacterized RmlC-like cupin family protein